MPSSKQKIRVAVIGGGNMGKNHLRNYFLLPEADLVGLADINPDAKKLADEYNAKFFTDYKKMLDELKPDAVSVVVPTTFHAEVAREVIKRDIHLLLEKPIASTTDEADELISLAKKHKVVFTVGHIEHYNPVVRTLKRIVDEGKLGRITSIVARRVGGFPAVEPRTDVIIDLAVHDIGIISLLLGSQPKKITSHGSRTRHSSEIDSAEILMDYGHASGFIQSNWLTPVKIRTISVTGSEGYIEANYITQELEFYQHGLGKDDDGFIGVIAEIGEQKKEVIKVDFEEPLKRELTSFIDNIKGGNKEIVSPTEARHALRLALEAVRPYTTKTKI